MVRGFFAGLMMGSTHPEDRSSVYSLCVNGIDDCRMIQEELSVVFGEQNERGLFDEAIYNDDAVMELLIEAGKHPSVANLRHLYNVMPNEATRLGVALGMLFALRIWAERPALAQHFVGCEQTRDEAEDGNTDASAKRGTKSVRNKRKSNRR